MNADSVGARNFKIGSYDSIPYIEENGVNCVAISEQLMKRGIFILLIIICDKFSPKGNGLHYNMENGGPVSLNQDNSCIQYWRHSSYTS